MKELGRKLKVITEGISRADWALIVPDHPRRWWEITRNCLMAEWARRSRPTPTVQS